MICIKYKCLSFAAEHRRVHSHHTVLLHHLLHSSALFRYRNNRRDLIILQMLYAYLKLVIVKCALYLLTQFIVSLL